MKLVILESPFAGDVSRNIRYARAATKDCLLRGESPFLSHLLYTQPGILDDDDPAERALGMAAGHDWIVASEYSVAYIDLGISPGMRLGIDKAYGLGHKVEFRFLPNWETVLTYMTRWEDG